MEKYFCKIKKSSLFANIAPSDLRLMLSCLPTDIKTYRKNELIFDTGDSITSIGLVVSGNVSVIRDDIFGNSNILKKIDEGEIFGISYACVEGRRLNATITAASDTVILYLEVSRILRVCSNACKFHTRLLQNLLATVAQNNFFLSSKLEHISQRTTRAKLMSYLMSVSAEKESTKFIIPFNRQQLADYLSVDRSAMSKELCSLRDDGIIRFEKNYFEIVQS